MHLKRCTTQRDDIDMRVDLRLPTDLAAFVHNADRDGPQGHIDSSEPMFMPVIEHTLVTVEPHDGLAEIRETRLIE
jgi:hypothetical protein